jgi:hypothetical protein
MFLSDFIQFLKFIDELILYQVRQYVEEVTWHWQLLSVTDQHLLVMGLTFYVFTWVVCIGKENSADKERFIPVVTWMLGTLFLVGFLLKVGWNVEFR